MKNSLFYILIVLFTTFTVWSQNKQFGQAILMETPKFVDSRISKVHEDYLNKLVNESNGLFVIYDWNETANTIDLYSQIDQSEKPVDVVHFARPVFLFSKDIKIEMNRNQMQKITNMRIPVNITMGYVIKSIYLPTNEILSVKTSYIIKPTNKDIVVTDYAKYFGARNPDQVLAKPNIKENKAIIDKIKSDFASTFAKNQNELFNQFQLKFNTKLDYFSAATDELYPIEQKIYPVSKKKNVIKIHPGKGIGAGYNDDFNMYEIVEIAGYRYLDKTISLEVEDVDSVGHSVSLGPALFTGKRMVNLIESGKQYYAAKSVRVENSITFKENKPLVRIALSGFCSVCDNHWERSMLGHPTIQLVARDLSELSYFDNLAKDERFLDYDLDQLTGKKVGAEIVVNFETGLYTAVEVSSGRIILSEATHVSLGADRNRNFGQRDVFSILTNYDPDTFSFKWVETTNESKGKTNEGVIFHPAGLETYTKYDVYTFEEIEVAGELLKKKNVIAQIRTGNYPFNYHLAKVKVLNGEKDLNQALSNGTSIFLARTEN